MTIRALTLLATLVAAPIALAETRATLRDAIVVTGDLVTLGDLVENAGPAGRVALFHAPDPGRHGTIQARRVIEAARDAGLAHVDLRGLSAVRVERAGRLVGEVDAIDAVATDLMRRWNTTDRARVPVRIDGAFPLTLDASTAANLVVERLSHDPTTGRFEASLVAVDEGGRRSRVVRLTGTAIEEIEVVRVRRTIARGEMVSASDVTLERAPRNRVPADAITVLAEAQGHAARRVLSEGAFVRTSEVERPRVIARNDTVTIVFESPNLVVTARGRANEAGAVGDTIDVQNVGSRRNIQATVAGPGKVVVRVAPSRRIAQVATGTTPPAATPPRN